MYQDTQLPEALFGVHVRRQRDELGITRAALAGALRDSDGIELDSAALSRLERGERPIRLDEAVALAKILDMTLDEMLQPASSLDERISQARRAVALARSDIAVATAEFEIAQAHLDRLVTLAGPGAATAARSSEHSPA